MASHETAMNQVAKSMRKQTTRREAMTEDEAANWNMRERAWAKLMEQTEMGLHEVEHMEKSVDNWRYQTNPDQRSTYGRTRGREVSART